MADVDYEELVQETIADIKERVEENDLDLEKVLEAEQANKDRTTLVSWLEERIDEQDAGQGDRSTDTAAGTASAASTSTDTASSPTEGGALSRLSRMVTSQVFVAGLLVGIVAASAAFYAGVGVPGGTASAASTADSVETYFADNSEGIPLQGVTVRDIQRMEGSDLYQVSMVLSAEFLNRTVEQNQTAVVTPGARYIFLNQPIDTTRPLAEQLGGQSTEASTQQQSQPQ